MRMSSGAIVGVVMVMVGTLGCASGGGIPTGGSKPKMGEEARTPDAQARRRMTRILVTGSSGQCEATIDDLTIVGKRNKKVAWLVEDGTTGCSEGEDWYIRLEFETEWNNGRNRVVNIDRDDIEQIRVHRNTPPTGANGHKYKIYLMYRRIGDDTKIPVIDPQLDIEM